MNNIFDFKRFGKYFIYDLNNARNTYGLSGLIIALSPVLAFVTYTIVGLIANGHVSDYPETLQVLTLIILCASLVISFTAKAYGNLTEKRLGSDWLMIPASGVEKTISMIVTSCFVVPAVIGAVYFASDWLLSIIFKIYPSSMIGSISFKQHISEEISFGAGNMFLATWCELVLAFTLGAIYFKRSKAGKTILSIFAISMVTSALIIMIINASMGLDSTNIEALMERMTEDLDAQKAARLINVAFTSVNAMIIAILCGLTYLRVKTMKH